MIIYFNYSRLIFTFFISLFAFHSHAGEITDMEWSILNDLKVTYFVGKSGQSIQVDCTALNEQKKPIGGGFSFTEGGVAVVRISVPTKYQNSDKLKIVCRP
jgi:hypothetical protein